MTLFLKSVSWFEVDLVKSAPNTTEGILLHIKRLCAIERIHGISQGLMTNAYRTSFANMLRGFDRVFPGNDSPTLNGASGSIRPALIG